jgi:NitT/TauT family transport system ATP-binding protein
VLDVIGLGHTYRTGKSEHAALGEVSFTVKEGEVVCVVGPSGCGKSTLLRAVSGLLRPAAGGSSLHGAPIDSVPDDLAVVFQDYSRSLMPWLKVAGNVELPLRTRKLTRRQRRERVEEALRWVSLDRAADQYPWQLSGGMQQRVAIARALAYRPTLVVMDEPFASVDAQTREDLEDLVLRMRTDYSMTVLLVTHDIDESVYLSDRIVVLSGAPATVVKTIDVDLPPRRHQIVTRESEQFVQLRGEVARLLKRDAGPEPVTEAR